MNKYQKIILLQLVIWSFDWKVKLVIDQFIIIFYSKTFTQNILILMDQNLSKVLSAKNLGLVTKSQLFKNISGNNLLCTSQLSSSSRQINLNQLNQKIAGVEKKLKAKDRQYLSPSFLRKSVDIESPKQMHCLPFISPRNETKNQLRVAFTSDQLRSSWNNPGLVGIETPQQLKDHENSGGLKYKYTNTDFTFKINGAPCQPRKNSTNLENHCKDAQSVQKTPIPFVQNTVISQRKDSNFQKKETGSNGANFKETLNNHLSPPQNNINKDQKFRNSINRSMEMFEKIKYVDFKSKDKANKSIVVNRSKTKVIEGFQLIQTIGKGKFGEVYLSKHLLTGFILAIKKIEKAKIKQYNMINQFIKEIKLHKSLDHPKIVKFYGFFQEKQNMYLVLQYMNGGTLFDYLNVVGTLKIKETVDFLRDIIVAIAYLHERSIAHRDIKPQNIVISTQGVAKLCDFGWSSVIDSTRHTYCGTLDYACPQILERKDYDLSVDVWSIGILTYEMLMGRPPFEDKDRKVVKQNILNVDKKQFCYSSEVPEQAKKFIEALIQRDSSKRPKIGELLKFALFANFGTRTSKKTL